MTEQQQIGGVEIDAGWTALKAGNWAAAKAVFEESLANGETPEALEGIGAAAQMMNEDPLTFDARERAYRLYLQRGDKGSAARIAAWPVSCTASPGPVVT